MDFNRQVFISVLLVFLKESCHTFNIDVKRPQIFWGPENAQFGYKVLQHEAEGKKWMLVSAPWEGTVDNRKGDVYRCSIGQDRNCARVHIGDATLQNISREISNMNFGMTLEDNQDNGFVACAPLWSQECGTSKFSTGICTKVNQNFQPTENIAPTVQRCSTYMDIVIVLDGSNSIYPWSEVQNFLSNILSKFFIDPEQIQVGVLQYGEVSVHEWSLREYRTVKEVVDAAKNISRREGRETRTAYAINMACTEAFTPERGARDGATRLLIVVTDGESHDGEQLPEALAECEKRNITRYAIAVLGHYIRRQQNYDAFINEIKYIASDPDEKYFFNVTDEAALNDIVDALGDRIFSLEGTLGNNGSSFELEMSQIGFSTHILEDGILFGAVGAYDWDGTVLKESKWGRIIPPREVFEKEFPVELKNHAAYLGYTVSSVTLHNGQVLYVAGAPRFKHKGKVILFNMTNDGSITISQAMTGEQIGSYFGSELCPVDVDGNGSTDVLLVAAPMYLGAGNKETGRVYIYIYSQKSFLLNGTLKADKKPQDSRFGYSLAAVPDLNHDGFNDVIVGAPLEDNHCGAIYIYHGYDKTILPGYKQRIPASDMNPALQYFGRSVSGQMDLDGDGLLDIAVGAQDTAVMLSSRPIVLINMSVEFDPPVVNVVQRNCQRNAKEVVCVSAILCFTVVSQSPSWQNSTVDIQYNTTLDDRKFSVRAIFDENSQKQLQKYISASVGTTACHIIGFHVVDTTDYGRPIGLGVHFRLNNTESGPVLNTGLSTTMKKSIPFYKDCGEDDECVSDLVLKAKMDISGSRKKPYIIRSIKKRVLVDVSLENKNENAYNTSFLLTFSRNLHFFSFSIKEDSQVKMECTALLSNSRSCNVSYPVFRSLAKVTFMLEFEFSCSFLLNRIQINLTADSDSTELNETLHDNTVQLFAVIRYEPDLFILSESSLNRYEVRLSRFSSRDAGPEFRTTFKMQNLGCYPISNFSINLFLPAMTYRFWPLLSVTAIRVDNESAISCHLQNMTDRMEMNNQTTVVSINPEHLMHIEQLNCSNTRCDIITCWLKRLNGNDERMIHVRRVVHDDFFKAAKFKSVKVVSTLALDNIKDHSLLFVEEFRHLTETILEIIRPKQNPISLWILIGSTIGGLLLLALIIFILWKLGFFTRKSQEDERHHEEKALRND
ncbi:integrin alpha-10 [Protopterus annectens]|uniref:integrin alpha-10 n=1 Tax=Protopterus annectens TaxID=7888 RepID=UPI001CFA3027|nr:integrin alpha-10 [Protopterus annectens]